MTTLQRRPARNASDGWVSRLKKQYPTLCPDASPFSGCVAAVFLDSGTTLPGTQVIQDTWILIFWPFDRGGRQRFVLADLGQSTAGSYKLLTSNHWYWLGHLDWYE